MGLVCRAYRAELTSVMMQKGELITFVLTRANVDEPQREW